MRVSWSSCSVRHTRRRLGKGNWTTSPQKGYHMTRATHCHGRRNTKLSRWSIAIGSHGVVPSCSVSVVSCHALTIHHIVLVTVGDLELMAEGTLSVRPRWSGRGWVGRGLALLEGARHGALKRQGSLLNDLAKKNVFVSNGGGQRCRLFVAAAKGWCKRGRVDVRFEF